MEEAWDKYCNRLRNDLYRLNMELSHWEAVGNRSIVTEINTLIAQIKRILDSEKPRRT